MGIQPDAYYSMMLPDPFTRVDGSRITDPEAWEEHRNYLKKLATDYIYGTMPPSPRNTRGEVLESRLIYDDLAIEEDVRIHFGPDESISFPARIVRPNRPGRFPVIVQNIFPDQVCRLEEEAVTQRGYVLAEFNKEDIAADGQNFWKSPLYRAYPDYSWGAILLWSWGHSRLADYLLTQVYSDRDKLMATGHSRGGKIALAAAIYDERFTLCAPNGSGCGGAGCFRFLGGRLGEGHGQAETVGVITEAFPHWWTAKLAEFGQHTHGPEGIGGPEGGLPLDLHTIKALIAPRALISTDALGDTWANPFGTQLTWLAAGEVYRFLGVPERNALHFRDGGHDYGVEDWRAVLDYADYVWFGKEPLMPFQTTRDSTPEDHGIHGDSPYFDWRMPVGSED